MKSNFLFLLTAVAALTACQPSEDNKSRGLPVLTDINGPVHFRANASSDGYYTENEEQYQKISSKPRCSTDSKVTSPANFIGKQWIWKNTQISKGTRYSSTESYTLAQYDDVKKQILVNQIMDQRRDGYQYSVTSSMACTAVADTKIFDKCVAVGTPVEQGKQSPNPYSKEKTCVFKETFTNTINLMEGDYFFNEKTVVPAKAEYRDIQGFIVCNADTDTRIPATKRSVLVKSVEVADFRTIPSCTMQNIIMSGYIVFNAEGKILDSERKELVSFPNAKE